MTMYVGQQEKSGPRYEPGGWIQWPDHTEHSIQFMQLLGAAQDGASCISECFRTAACIIPGDDKSWHGEWLKLAERIKECGDSALECGHIETAKSNWLRALNYYRAAACFLDAGDERRLAMLDSTEACSRSYLKHVTPRGEIVRIPYEDSFLHGYFLRAPGAPCRAPVVLCFGSPKESKEDLLVRLPGLALARGLSLLLVDLPGQGATYMQNKQPARHDQEISIGYCVDYLFSRDDVDQTRIVVYGDGLGGSYASRAAGSDIRFAAAVCDGGIWDHIERRFVASSISGGEQLDREQDLRKYCISNQIKCPYLVTVGEHDYIDVKDVVDLYNHLLGAGAKIDLKIFSEQETGASHCQIDNQTVGKGFIFDWISKKIGIGGVQLSASSDRSDQPGLFSSVVAV
jgi:dienelactone hydrolase